jgi:hypothetical protein
MSTTTNYARAFRDLYTGDDGRAQKLRLALSVIPAQLEALPTFVQGADSNEKLVVAGGANTWRKNLAKYAVELSVDDGTYFLLGCRATADWVKTHEGDKQGVFLFVPLPERHLAPFHPPKKLMLELLKKENGYTRLMAMRDSMFEQTWTKVERPGSGKSVSLPWDIRYVNKLLDELDLPSTSTSTPTPSLAAPAPNEAAAAATDQAWDEAVTAAGSHVVIARVQSQDARAPFPVPDAIAALVRPSSGSEAGLSSVEKLLQEPVAADLGHLLLDPTVPIRDWPLADPTKAAAVVRELRASTGASSDPLSSIHHGAVFHHALRLSDCRYGESAIYLQAMAEIQRRNPRQTLQPAGANALTEFRQLLTEGGNIDVLRDAIRVHIHTKLIEASAAAAHRQ